MIAVRPITLVMGKISYEDKAQIETLRKLGLDTEPNNCCKISEKGLRGLVCSVKAICKLADNRGSATERKPGIAVGRKQHEQRKMLDILSC